MDFFQAQDSARRRSRLLVFYFLAAVVLIIAAVYTVTIIATATIQDPDAEALEWRWWQPDLLLLAAGGSIAIIASGSLLKTMSLRSGGGVVARSLGGVLVNPDTTDLHHRRLLNVVEEMAIASGVRVPEVYVLPEPGINAFAAGYSPDDAAVAVTQGSLETLSRDELQGVVAHEFSHILNGDMRLNIRLIGLLFGILLIALIGRGLIQSLRFARLSSGGRGKNSGGVVFAIVLIGLALIIVGYVGVIFGRLMQAAVSRQREFLADASAVQFTRNPSGIAGALKKIGGLVASSRIANTHAAETSHLFFANAMQGSAFNLFATHPPLDVRIRAIDPSFDGRFAPVTPRRIEADDDRPPRRPPSGATPPPLRAEQFVARVASIGVVGEIASGSMLDLIPETLRAAAHDAGRARAVVLALLATPGAGTVATRQREALDRALDSGERAVFGELLEQTARLPASARLPLVDLALPTIRRLSPSQIDGLLHAVRALIAADDRTTLLEFSLEQVIIRYLHPPRWTGDTPGAQVMSLEPLADAIALILTAIARAGSSDSDVAQRAFNSGAARLGLIRDRLVLQPEASLAPDRLVEALSQLERAALPIKSNLLDAMARAAGADGVIMPAEVELLRAVSAAIDCPAPPMTG